MFVWIDREICSVLPGIKIRAFVFCKNTSLSRAAYRSDELPRLAKMKAYVDEDRSVARAETQLPTFPCPEREGKASEFARNEEEIVFFFCFSTLCRCLSRVRSDNVMADII